MKDRVTRDLLAALDAYERAHGPLEQAKGLRASVSQGDAPDPSPGKRAARQGAGDPPSGNADRQPPAPPFAQGNGGGKDAGGKDAGGGFPFAKKRARARFGGGQP